ncbi:uncharacterized protein TNCV_1461441 [Trichonephila clavipes]|nr:uncharacterized protein TNCV_1461441 [Trichonephila clavipes]
MQRACLNHHNNFCYVCDKVTLKFQRRNPTPLVKHYYEFYFGCKVGTKQGPGPHISVIYRVDYRLTAWKNGTRHMPFAIPMIWREPKDLSSDCYFCLTNIKGITPKSKHTVVYSDFQSAMRPVPHSELPIQKPPAHVTLDKESLDSDRSKEEEKTVCGDTQLLNQAVHLSLIY